jgi:hypothetical protein
VNHTIVAFKPAQTEQTGRLMKIKLAIEWMDRHNTDGRMRLVLFKNDDQIAEKDCFGAA